ncbi:MAG: hypothetical protein IIB38_09010, partial [Candidatus Hydrogenedentes bacterium]|nr:hypothetical protein [Candidatus Hydrogenedentota bacterium]
ALGDSVLEVNGILTSGIKDIAFHVNADGSIDTTKINYTVLIDDDTVSIELIESKGGNVTIVGNVAGDGTILVLDGFSHVDIVNDSDKTLLITDLDIDDRIEGRININGVDRTVPGTVNGVTLATYGHESGSVDIQNNGDSDVHLAGLIANSSGITIINAALGNIVSVDGDQLILAETIGLNAPNGYIGTAAENIHIDLTASRLDAFARDDIHITEVNGDLGLGSLLSLAGVIRLIADGSIVDAAPEDIINLSARQVALLALHGGIGAPGKRVVADTFGIFNMVAAGNIFVEERIGTFVAAGHTLLEDQFGDLVADHSLGGDVLDLFMPSGLPTIRQVFFRKNIIIRVGDVNLDIDDIEKTVFSPYEPEQMMAEERIAQTTQTEDDDVGVDDEVFLWMGIDPSLVELGQD